MSLSEGSDPRNPAGVRVGDIYEDCSFHPVLCTDIEDNCGLVLSGVSLIDGTYPRSCDARYCEPVLIPAQDVMAIKGDLAGYAARRQTERAAAAQAVAESA